MLQGRKMNPDESGLLLESSEEMLRLFPELKPTGKNSLNYWRTNQNE